MDIQEILKEAKIRYPPGTKFLSAYSGNEFIVEGDLVIDKHSTGIKDEEGGWYVYDCGKWAEVVESAEPKALPIFN